MHFPSAEKAIPPEVDSRCLSHSPPLTQDQAALSLILLQPKKSEPSCCRWTNHNCPKLHPSPAISTNTNIFCKHTLHLLGPQHPPALLTLFLFRQPQSLRLRLFFLPVHRQDLKQPGILCVLMRGNASASFDIFLNMSSNALFTKWS